MARSSKSSGFSLVELVIVIVIIGVIAAIAVPRISRGASGAGSSGLRGDLHVLRQAIELYAGEHNHEYPPKDTFEAVMTQYTDEAHDPAPAKDATHVNGPYLVAVPKCKGGDGKGQNGVSDIPGAGVGWIYDELKGLIKPNAGATAADENGTLYEDY